MKKYFHEILHKLVFFKKNILCIFVIAPYEKFDIVLEITADLMYNNLRDARNITPRAKMIAIMPFQRRMLLILRRDHQ